MRKLSVSFFDGGSNGGALREICDFRRDIGRKNLRENGRKQAAGAASVKQPQHVFPLKKKTTTVEHQARSLYR